ncbi:hypothetical protein P3X46_034750 [Hevea brasiliensis]|uniref:RING-type E3 ubiquitin transferase n=1 Tax=Hevea brasiliensis TaxID=3981 RepID=A0ABQ9KC71_HEVBR|nr:RING-H2 finger protein ATL52 [Hevea brasiliensis]KAJ9131838.1 hypothetical protein P3X46_034750 [Hevea brasiliensis]
MGSVGNQNPWATYDTYKDCSQQICSIYCPQWCYIIFPPPPPFNLGDDDSGTDFSPLIIAVIGILASAFILVSYYTIISKYCRRGGHGDNSLELGENHDQITNEAWQGSAAGLDESLIKSITVCKYKKGDGFVESSDCSVCLSEFQENENLRFLPKCNHAFHLPCIDPWLKSHASCPLCRANIAPTNILPSQPPPPQGPPPPIQETPPSTVVSALEYQHRINDAVLVVQDLQGNVPEETVVSLVVCGDNILPKPTIQDLGLSTQNMEQETENINEIREEAIQPIRRSVSLNSSLWHTQVSIADILRLSEDENGDDGYKMRDTEKNRIEILNFVRSPLAIRRSTSTGRFIFTRYEKGRSSMIPN